MFTVNKTRFGHFGGTWQWPPCDRVFIFRGKFCPVINSDWIMRCVCVVISLALWFWYAFVYVYIDIDVDVHVMMRKTGERKTVKSGNECFLVKGWIINVVSERLEHCQPGRHHQFYSQEGGNIAMKDAINPRRTTLPSDRKWNHKYLPEEMTTTPSWLPCSGASRKLELE